jgi:hypothetical protein
VDVPNPVPNAPLDTWAEVRAAGRVMRYRRRGAGPPVLLVGPIDGAADLLAARFRVIIPELPPAEADLAGWLSAFLDGLGTPSVTVFAVDEYRPAALEVARLDRERVQGVLHPSELTRYMVGG